MLTTWVREQLYSVAGGARRSRATTAVAASAAERAHGLSDDLPDWRNAVSDEWRAHLVNLWSYLQGDETQHHALSTAIASFLAGPLNHNEGEAGPDDFDRPQTIASYYAVVSAVIGAGVDCALIAIGETFDLLDIKYDQEFDDDRANEVDAEIARIRLVVEQVVAAQQAAPAGSPFSQELVKAIGG